jgi:hypothetical protein
MEAVITEAQLESLINRYKVKPYGDDEIERVKNIYENFTDSQKSLVKDLLQAYYPEKFNKLNEERYWWNTLGDVLGFLDPTPTIDIINGISYFIQGEQLYGFLSMLAAIPFADPLIKPIMGLGKNSKVFKGMEGALKMVKTNPSKAAGELAKVSQQSGAAKSLINAVSTWGPKLMSIIDRLPGGKWMGLKQIIKDWVNVFVKAAKKNQSIYRWAERIAKNYQGDPKQIKKLMDYMKTTTALGKNKFALSGLKGGLNAAKKQGVWRTVMGGMPRIWGNRERRSLMNRTKFYAGLLDYLGITSFKNVEDVAKDMGEDEFNRKMGEYSQTPQAEQYLYDDLSGYDGDDETSQQSSYGDSTPSQSDRTKDVITDFIFGPLMGSTI